MPAEKHLLATCDEAKGLKGHCGQTRWDPESVSVLCGVPHLPMTGEKVTGRTCISNTLPSPSGLHGEVLWGGSQVRGQRGRGHLGWRGFWKEGDKLRRKTVPQITLQ